jgi:(p)ppGpp synthase/HD superfamily hydrolase
MNKVQMAIEVATKAHEGQKDKIGEDYIKHPLRVHRNLTTNPKFKNLDALTREDCEVAALLHDVIEDTSITAEDLLAMGFSPRSIKLVQLLTKDKTKPKEEYFVPISEEPLARMIKLADIADNRNRKRVAGLDSEVAERLKQKYIYAMEAIGIDQEDQYWMDFAIDYDIELEDYEDDDNEDEG